MDIVCLGEFIMDMFSVETGCRLAEVTAFKPTPGGAPANVAVASARLGCRSAFLGMVGDDVFGRRLQHTLEQERVETRGMRFTQQARTTLNFIALPDVHHPEFLFYRNPGADSLLSKKELDIGLLSGTRTFHFGSLSLVEDPIRSATLCAIDVARAAGAFISFDVNYRPTCWPDPETAVANIMAVIPRVDLLKMNQDELSLLSGRQDADAACATLLKEGPSLCVVTMGAAGCYFRTRAGGGSVAGFAVGTRDTSGCGDAFMAALLYQLSQKGLRPAELHFRQLQSMLLFANAAGALTATNSGVIPALPNLKQVNNFIRKNHSLQTEV